MVERLTYISHGNIPSLWAHSVQAMKMAEALASLVKDFVLLTQVHPLVRKWKPVDLSHHYGLQSELKIVPLPSWLAPPRRLFRHVYAWGFSGPAAEFARRRGSDLVVTRLPAAGVACIERGLRTVVEFHANPAERQFRSLASHGKNPLLLAVVTTLEPLAESYRAAGIPEEKLILLPAAVDFTAYEERLDGADVRRRWNIVEDAFLVVYSGHLYDEKGLPTLIEAARRAPQMSFLVVGGWPEDVRARQRQARGLANLRFTGFLPNGEVPAHLAAADAVVLPNSNLHPSARTTCPLKLFEYLASGRPLVASNLEAFSAFLKPGHNCVLFEPDNPEALLMALEEVRCNPEDSLAMGGRARDEARSRSWRSRAEKMLEFAIARW